MVLLPLGSPATPGKALTIRAGSLMPPAMREVSSTLILRALRVAMSLRSSPLRSGAFTSNSFSWATLSCIRTSNTSSLALVSSRLAMRCSSNPTIRTWRSRRPVGTLLIVNRPSRSVVAPRMGSEPTTTTVAPIRGMRVSPSTMVPRTVWRWPWAMAAAARANKKRERVVRRPGMVMLGVVFPL